MHRLCQTMQVDCEDRGLDVSIEMQSELYKTVTTATQKQALPVLTTWFPKVPKITTTPST